VVPLGLAQIGPTVRVIDKKAVKIIPRLNNRPFRLGIIALFLCI